MVDSQVGVGLGHPTVRRLSSRPSAKTATTDVPKTEQAQPRISFGLRVASGTANKIGITAARISSASTEVSIVTPNDGP